MWEFTKKLCGQMWGMFLDDATKQLSFVRLVCLGIATLTLYKYFKGNIKDFPVNNMVFILTAYGLHKLASTYTINKDEKS